MGRLNYSNRKIEGVKLGQVCAKDLIKRLPGATSHKAALRDCSVELEVPGRALTDPGLCELASGLMRTYSGNNTAQTVIKLEELNISENGLTPHSLLPLTKVILAARDDLHDLDISNNVLTVTTREDVQVWEVFLRALSRCCMLRRIDLSGNALGAKALEVLSRVYSQEGSIDLILPPDIAESLVFDGLDSGMRRLSTTLIASEGPFSPQPEGSSKSMRKGSRNGPYARPLVATSLTAKAPKLTEQSGLSKELFATTKGVRALPYLVLANSLVDDASALYLSYIIVQHHDPHVLGTRVPAAKAGQSAQQLAAYDSQPQCRGIIYCPNESLENSAIRVLSLAEKVRDKFTIGDGDNRNANMSTQGAQAEVRSGDRRSSQPAIDTSQESLLQDLDRARSRIQTTCIENSGPAFNDLWITALKMLMLSRLIQPQKAKKLGSLEKPSHLPTIRPKQLVVRTLELTASPAVKKPNPWGTPLTPKSTNTNLSNQQRQVKGRKKNSIDLPPKMTDTLRRDGKQAFVIDREYKSMLPCGFTEDIWRRILGSAVGAEGVLSPSQQRSVLRHGMDRETLKKEQDYLGLKEALQIWHCLDQMDCLAYAMR